MVLARQHAVADGQARELQRLQPLRHGCDREAGRRGRAAAFPVAHREQEDRREPSPAKPVGQDPFAGDHGAVAEPDGRAGRHIGLEELGPAEERVQHEEPPIGVAKEGLSFRDRRIARGDGRLQFLRQEDEEGVGPAGGVGLAAAAHRPFGGRRVVMGPPGLAAVPDRHDQAGPDLAARRIARQTLGGRCCDREIVLPVQDVKHGIAAGRRRLRRAGDHDLVGRAAPGGQRPDLRVRDHETFGLRRSDGGAGQDQRQDERQTHRPTSDTAGAGSPFGPNRRSTRPCWCRWPHRSRWSGCGR